MSASQSLLLVSVSTVIASLLSEGKLSDFIYSLIFNTGSNFI